VLPAGARSGGQGFGQHRSGLRLRSLPDKQMSRESLFFQAVLFLPSPGFQHPVSADERGKESIDSDNGTDFIPNSLTSLGIRDDVTKKYI